jgi:hypothetical protein
MGSIPSPGELSMNVPALLIAIVIGSAFFVAEYELYYQPHFIEVEVDEFWSLFRTEHGKARAAVSRSLIKPDTAIFSGLKTVEADATRYVCGSVKAMDEGGHFVQAGFVYAVANDSARIDDDHRRITSLHSDYKPCPAEESDKIADQKTLISPGAVSMIRAAQKVVPKADPSALSTLTTLAPSGGGGSSGGTMEGQLGQLAGKGTAAAAAFGSEHNSGQAVQASLEDESNWHSDRPPAAWPIFPPGHPLAKPTDKRTAAQALALAKHVEDRWRQSNSSGQKAQRPSSDEVNEACRALLTIDAGDKDYAKAWAAFVRLRRIAREMSN